MSDITAAPGRHEGNNEEGYEMTTTMPERTSGQRQDALAKAAEARTARADLLKSVEAGRTSPVEVLTSNERAARRLTVRRLIEAVPGYGRARAEKLLARAQVRHPNRRVGGLGTRQVERLTAELAG